MMKQARRFNWKARQGDISAQEQKKSKAHKKIEVEVDPSLKELPTDESNPLVLPSKKDKSKRKPAGSNAPAKPPLSKKKKKMLEQMIARKEKRANRSSLFEELAKYQLGKKELELLNANSDLHSRATKRSLDGNNANGPTTKKQRLENGIKGAFRKKNLLAKADKPKPWENNPNILGPDPSSSSEGENEEQDGNEPSLNNSLNGIEPETTAKQERTDLQKDLDAHHDPAAPEEKSEQRRDDNPENDNDAEDEECEDEESSEECEEETDESGEDESGTEEKATVQEENDIIEKLPADTKENEKNEDGETSKEDNSCSTSSIPINLNYVPVHRTPEMNAARLKLPIMGMEQEIMEAISENPVVVICGETGSGKTTQVPQFLYEAGYAKDGKIIGITEPRRVAASAMSFRVQKEMSLSSKEVSYQTRFEGTLSPDTQILFMTDGVLIKMVEEDAFVSKFSAIIIDEAHERSIHSDLLIGLFSRVVHIRKEQGNPLKLIIMSATLKVEEFTSNPHLFKTAPPLLKVDSRQFPVDVHFNKYTPKDTEYLNLAYSKICKIHRRLPEGGILVFVTGKNEIDHLIQRLRRTFRSKASKKNNKTQIKAGDEKGNGGDKEIEDNSDKGDEEDDEVTQKEEAKLLRKYKGKKALPLPSISLDKYSIEPKMDDLDEDNNAFKEILNDDGDDEPVSSKLEQPLYVLPLYAKLPPEKQKLVFKGPPAGSRLCVVATNVAETSITIPNIKYVVDTGKVKMRLYDRVSGISKYEIFWISKASAEQRTGRAGRTAPGHCYRLYSPSMYNYDFPLHAPPEISKKPLDDIVLQLKNLGVLRVIRFPFPTQPSEESLMAAEERLIKLGAIRGPPKDADKEERERLQWMGPTTQLGDKMAQLPISPKFSRILIAARKDPCLPYLVALVAAISVEEIFLDASEAKNDEERAFWKKVKLGWTFEPEAKKLGDLALYLKAVVASDEAGMTKSFSRDYGLRHKAIIEIRKTRDHIFKNLIKIYPELEASSNLKLNAPSEQILRTLREVMLTGLLPYSHIARRIPDGKGAYESMELSDKQVYIHPGSMLFKNPDAHFVAYQEMVETSKLYLKGVSMVEASWIPRYAYSECTFSDPMEEPSPRYDSTRDKVVCYMRARCGNWEFPAVEVPFPEDMVERYKWFGYHFLNGDVIASLKELVPQLVLPANTMVKTWAHLKPQAVKLLDALRVQKIDSKKRLLKVWERIPNYLLNEYREWLKKDHTATLLQNWPPKE